jgi:hypothetical protein
MLKNYGDLSRLCHIFPGGLRNVDFFYIEEDVVDYMYEPNEANSAKILQCKRLFQQPLW